MHPRLIQSVDLFRDTFQLFFISLPFRSRVLPITTLPSHSKKQLYLFQRRGHLCLQSYWLYQVYNWEMLWGFQQMSSISTWRIHRINQRLLYKNQPIIAIFACIPITMHSSQALYCLKQLFRATSSPQPCRQGKN